MSPQKRKHNKVSFYDRNHGKVWVEKAPPSEPPAVAGGHGSEPSSPFCFVDGSVAVVDDDRSDCMSIRTGMGDSIVESSAGDAEDPDPRSCGGEEEAPLQEGATEVRQRTTWKDTVPPELLQRGEDAVPVRERKGNEGNVTVGFANVGNLPKDRRLRERTQQLLQRGPAMIWTIAECSRDMEKMLQETGSPPVTTPPPGDAAASSSSQVGGPAAVVAGSGPAAKLQSRAAFQFLTVRGSEDNSLCIAARANVCEQLQVLYWRRIFDGEYRTKHSKKAAYSRLLVAEATFDQSLAWFGKSLTICCAHLHYLTARCQKGGGFRESHVEFWKTLAEVIQEKK